MSTATRSWSTEGSSRADGSIGEDLVDGGDLVGHEDRIGIAVVRNAEHAREHPTFSAFPGCVIDAQGLAIRVAGGAGEQAPGNDRLDRGVADSARAPVDDADQSPAVRQ